VLDAACGEGYGSALLAGAAERVVGVDLDEETVAHARRRYGGAGNLEFRAADCTDLPFEDASFDRVVSFETLEHLEAHEALIDEFARVLAPGGVLVISTPDRARYSDERGYENEFHVRELYRDEFDTLLGRRFPARRLLGQKLAFTSAIFETGDCSSLRFDVDEGGRVREAPRFPHPALYWIAVCARSDADLPPAEPGVWLFDDAEESVYAHYEGEIRRNMAAGGLLAEREREIERLQEALAEARAAPFWRRWFGGG
jgi:SAM-dependent methyltransferase